MILKNIEKAPRKLRDRLGKWYVVEPNKTIELDKPRYDERVFHIVEKMKQVLSGPKKKIQKKEDDLNGTRYME